MSQLSTHSASQAASRAIAAEPTLQSPSHSPTHSPGRGQDRSKVDAAAAASSTGRLLADAHALLKPRITVMVAVIAGIGYMLGLKAAVGTGIEFNGWVFTATLLGTSLSCMAAAVFNQVIEREVDARMPRTADRPLATGRVGVTGALTLGWALTTAGLVLLLLVGWVPAMLSAVTIASYAMVYTPLKRVSSVSTLVGAVPGALPPVIGYAAVTGGFDARIGVMFGIMFLWQLPHFLAIAWLYRADYAAGGMPMLPVVDPTGVSTFRQMLLGCMALLPLGLLPTLLGMAGMVYFTGALLAGGLFLASAIALAVGRSARHARVTFFVSLIYLPVVFALVLIDAR